MAVRRIVGGYDPHRVESEVKRFWEENNIYKKVKEMLKGKPTLYFLDGPPYPSSDVPHAGTAWNKVLKDSLLRFWRMNGYNVIDTPGYDCHGLPIEVAVEKKLGVKVKREIESRIGVERFIEECRRMVEENIRGLTHWFKELGVFMDWDNPYLTMRDEYIEAAWWLIKKAHERGLLERDKRIVYWCPRCGTTLAEYEVEYREIEDPSIYVKFPIRARENEYLLVWTTTPWTLPANTFVMAHPEAIYVKVRVGDEYLILAKPRLHEVMEEAGVSNYEVVDEFPGRILEGLEYIHPLSEVVPAQKRLEKYHRVYLFPEYVSLYEGTGLVHSAPGHGFEDFEAAKRLGIEEIVSPIDDEGRFTEEAGRYTGIPAREANKLIIEDLKKKGALFHASIVKHRYPVCWRCKTPTLLRATTQWVIKVTKLKDRLREESRKARWIPGWAYERLSFMIDNLQDWVLSRQRYWGTPLPIWQCPHCGYTLVVGSIEEMEKYGGRRPKELHKPWIDEVTLRCPKCGHEMKRVPDVADVWFDSGVSFYASLGHPEKKRSLLYEKRFKAKFITEGHDQTRGWFFSLLRAGVIGFNEIPYENVLVHGFMLDEKGREMHKSLGNYVATDEILRRAGADVFRLWVLQNTIWEDAKFSWKALDEARSVLNVAWNVFVFASTYMELDRFSPKEHSLEKYWEHLRPEDKWILSRTYRIINEATRDFMEYRVHEAVKKLASFIIEDVSHWYVRLIRRRVWVEEETADKYAAYATLYNVLKTWLIAISAITPFFAEKLYQEFVRPSDPSAKESIHMEEWPKPPRNWEDRRIEEYMKVVREVLEAVAALRMKARLKLRQPIRRVMVFTEDKRVIEAISRLKDILLYTANAKEVEVVEPKRMEEYVTYVVEPIYSTIGPEFKALSKSIFRYLEENGDKVARDILSKGYHEAIIEGTKIRLEERHVKITPSYKAGYYAKTLDWGSIVIDTTLSEREIAEGFARDVVRRIQYMRKEMNLDIEDKIRITIIVADKEYADYIEMFRDYIMGETRATKLDVSITSSSKEAKTRGYARKWSIGPVEVIIALEKESAG
ncbi:MAG: isoleucine--tRNA ligase [Pyrodictiaceae archaeon]